MKHEAIGVSPRRSVQLPHGPSLTGVGIHFVGLVQEMNYYPS